MVCGLNDPQSDGEKPKDRRKRLPDTLLAIPKGRYEGVWGCLASIVRHGFLVKECAGKGPK